MLVIPQKEINFYRIFYKIYEFYARKVLPECSSFIKTGSKILDLGCGFGIIGKTFTNSLKVDVTGVDIVDRRAVPLNFHLYNGRNLPFGNNNFDVVFISYVLHHCHDPIFTLKEAKRVTKEKIIIYEDLPENLFLKLICKIHGFTFASFFQKNQERGIFKNDREWKAIFNDLGLKLVFERKIWSFLKRKIYVLEKMGA